MTELQKLAEELETMSVEDFRKEFLHLNGIMTEEILERILNKVNDLGSLNSDNLWYSNKELYQDFIDVFHYIDAFAKNKVSWCSDFPEMRVYFSYKGKTYTWRLVVGQGSFQEIYACTDVLDYEELKVDCDLRFFKRG